QRLRAAARAHPPARCEPVGVVLSGPGSAGCGGAALRTLVSGGGGLPRPGGFPPFRGVFVGEGEKKGWTPGGGPRKEATPELTETVCTCIKDGNFREVAARYCGIKRSTLYKWFRLARREPDSVFANFANAILQAEAEAEVLAVKRLKMHSFHDP